MENCLKTSGIAIEHLVLSSFSFSGTHLALRQIRTIVPQFWLQLLTDGDFGLAILLIDDLGGITQGMKLTDLMQYLGPDLRNGAEQ